MPKKKSTPYDKLDEGTFTEQAKAKKMTINKFADYTIKNYKDKKSKYNPTLKTYRRALFYKNLVKKKKSKKK
tara:strand:- start:313 stop:528 length:216 start_codon:yes stop_codon:yes gene_type:complete